MNNKGRGLAILIIILAVMCVVFLAAGSILISALRGFDWWNEIPDRVKNVEEFTISQTQQAEMYGVDIFEFSSVSEDIDIIYEDTNTITVELNGTYRSARGQVELRKITKGDTVHIYVDYPKILGLFSWNNTDMVITMPMDMGNRKLIFNSVSGDVDITAGMKAGEILINTTSGDIHADDVQCGEFKCQSVSGELDLTGYMSEIVRVETVSGDTEIMIFGETKKVSVSGVSGNVEIYLEKDAGFKFEFNTVTGRFKCDFPVYSQGGKNDREGYTENEADMELDIDTVSGNLDIRN